MEYKDEKIKEYYNKYKKEEWEIRKKELNLVSNFLGDDRPSPLFLDLEVEFNKHFILKTIKRIAALNLSLNIVINDEQVISKIKYKAAEIIKEFDPDNNEIPLDSLLIQHGWKILREEIKNEK